MKVLCLVYTSAILCHSDPRQALAANHCPPASSSFPACGRRRRPRAPRRRRPPARANRCWCGTLHPRGRARPGQAESGHGGARRKSIIQGCTARCRVPATRATCVVVLVRAVPLRDGEPFADVRNCDPPLSRCAKCISKTTSPPAPAALGPSSRRSPAVGAVGHHRGPHRLDDEDSTSATFRCPHRVPSAPVYPTGLARARGGAADGDFSAKSGLFAKTCFIDKPSVGLEGAPHSAAGVRLP